MRPGGRSKAVAVGSMVLVLLLALHDRGSTANVRSHIESVRKPPLVYLGVVRSVEEIRRDKIGIRARATVDVQRVFRGPETAPPAQARVEFWTYDDKSSGVEGGYTYHRVSAGTMFLVFAPSFAIEPRYLYSGTRAQLLKYAEALHQGVAGYTDAELKFHEITEADRRAQVELYERAARFLRATP